MLAIKRFIDKIAPLNTTVLIQGETGTGKEIVAKLIHLKSYRSNKRFVVINCATIKDELLESHLFGHMKGAFTGAHKTTKGFFEVADGGTIFLDEIAEMPQATQAKLLRAIQTKQIYRLGSTDPIDVDVRIIAATNKNLEEEVKKGRFREDLYYRLKVIDIYLPPLRERKDDIPLLANYFIKKFSIKHNKNIKGITDEALSYLTSLPWKGNVRELENKIERAVALCDGEYIDLDNFQEPYYSSQTDTILTPNLILKANLPLIEAKREFEKKYIINLLKKTKGNVTKAAKLAQIPRQNLHKKIKQFNINIDDFRIGGKSY